MGETGEKEEAGVGMAFGFIVCLEIGRITYIL
jgi:hypothetical protein